jgi:DMSO/TMAO reductase YedYZ molybdopterin-dependent catalytic subunit
MRSRTLDRSPAPDLPQAAEPRHRSAGAFVGLASGAAALGAAQLVAGVTGGMSSPMVAVGSAAIDATPGWLKDFAIRTFGTHDKRALLIGIAAILAIAAIVLGAASVRRPRVGVIGLLALGAIGVIASLTRPVSGIEDAVPSILGTAVGIAVFRWLRRSTGVEGAGRDHRAAARSGGSPVIDRRRLLWNGGLVVGAAAASGLGGQYLVRRSSASASRAAARIPAPASPAPPVPGGADLKIPGLGPFITSNDRFYRVDTTIFTPAVDADSWQLRVHGMVDREVTIDYRELLRRPLIERDITLTCVSDPVGGPYISNARWIGAPLKDLLDEAGVHQGASQIVSRSSDGFTVGTPTAIAMDGRDAMLAVAMNGEALPLAHGFPVRMIVPGLYGYVSATKWIVDIELTTFQAFDAYWVHRGWAQQAPIKTESRIDTPRANASVSAGTVNVAGVAWAQHRGIERVEVRVDMEPWATAELAAQDTVDTWRQWVFRWDAPSGDHTLQVRATDDTGATQTGTPTPPVPNGATGYHTIFVRAG